jgi:hypothetical protein
MRENRKFERYELPLEIRVSWPGRAEQVGMTKDFSDGGAFVMVVFDPEPPLDTFMELQMTSQVMGHDAPILRGRVIRIATDGIAFEFIPSDEN